MRIILKKFLMSSSALQNFVASLIQDFKKKIINCTKLVSNRSFKYYNLLNMLLWFAIIENFAESFC